MPQGANHKWMADAFKPSTKGLFTHKAKAHGEGVQEYAAEVGRNPDAPTKLKREAALARRAKKGF